MAHLVPTQEPVVLSVPRVSLARTGRLPHVVQAVQPADEDQAFEIALAAITAAYKATTDPEGMWLALRSAVNLCAGRDARTGEK
ncbi:hypothetical protein [Streptomyces sediminimaris]|uniref:hypothetical protein n=1 Tax=Streptomyces sediminimaris TaxID=3383721 RepID=UPI003999C8EF